MWSKRESIYRSQDKGLAWSWERHSKAHYVQHFLPKNWSLKSSSHIQISVSLLKPVGCVALNVYSTVHMLLLLFFILAVCLALLLPAAVSSALCNGELSINQPSPPTSYGWEGKHLKKQWQGSHGSVDIYTGFTYILWIARNKYTVNLCSQKRATQCNSMRITLTHWTRFMPLRNICIWLWSIFPVNRIMSSLHICHSYRS